MNNDMYSFSEIRELFRRATVSGMNIPKEIQDMSIEQLTAICNGIGSETMSPKVRTIVTKIFSALESTAMIHDYHYSLSDGSIEGQAHADAEFLKNGIIECDFLYPWYDPRRYWNRFKCLRAYDTLRAFGRQAWLESFYHNYKKGNIK